MKNLTLFIFGLFLIFPHSLKSETCGGAEGLVCCNTVTSSSGYVCAIPANNKYIFTLRRFGFEQDDGTVTWVGTETSFNAALSSVGATMGNFVSGQSLPVGTYVAVRPEVKLEMTVNGSGVSTSDSVACTSAGDKTEDLATVMDNLSDSIPSCDTSPNVDCNTGDGYMRIRDTQLGNFSITKTSSRTLIFKFDVGSGVLFTAAGGSCTYKSMGPLDVSMSFSN